MRISKWRWQEKQNTSNFPKNEHFWTPDTHAFSIPHSWIVYVSWGEMFVFRKIWCALFPRYLWLEIRPLPYYRHIVKFEHNEQAEHSKHYFSVQCSFLSLGYIFVFRWLSTKISGEVTKMWLGPCQTFLIELFCKWKLTVFNSLLFSRKSCHKCLTES